MSWPISTGQAHYDTASNSISKASFGTFYILGLLHLTRKVHSVPLSKLSRILIAVGGFLMMTPPASPADTAQVIILGSGTPIPDPASSGPSVAVVINGRAYLFDAGAGVVRRAQAAAEKFGIAALDATS